MEAIKNWYKSRSNAFRAAAATIAFSFVTTIGLQFLGLLTDLQEWVDTGTAPDLDLFGKAVVSAVISAAIGAVNYLVRAVQQAKNPAAGPQYPS